MKIDVSSVRRLLKAFDFKTLFREQLGWDKHQAELALSLDGETHMLTAVAEKRGFAVYVCPTIPDRPTRLRLDRQVTKSSREHLIIYADKARGEQLWEWVRREPGKPAASRDYRLSASQSGDLLIQKLEMLVIALEEEERLTIVDVAGRVSAALDVDKITKRFYERFKTEHAAFMKKIKGIKHLPDLQWYTSLMLNRLMFVYFIQRKNFLDGDPDYLRNRLSRMRQTQGKDKFFSFYRHFLLRLLHEGLGQAESERKPDLDKLLGMIPYLDGGFFEVHDLEEKYPDIDIPDIAFVKLFEFFDAYRWHLDERPLRDDREINPDVVGYIFEKYINQKQMGAYYTKEDITEYISTNTIIPFIFDAAEKKCAIAFKPNSALWRMLRDDPDRYIYATVRHGVVNDKGEVISLPKEIEAGVTDVSKRAGWNKPAPQPFALPTETWREHVTRRERCLQVRENLRSGEVNKINHLVALNLDIWQFARDAIVNCEGPELLRAFYRVIAGHIPRQSNEKYERGLSVLDPTCGSGAFLFAALRIIESLYSDCLEHMRRFVDELEHSGEKHRPEEYADFKAVLAEVHQHPNERYFVLKSTIINNLFGVDIMEEAVEICKLRLFLKLVAQVERVEQIEPLPDIDFNVRVGNTLVGYLSLAEVRRSQEGQLGFGDKDLNRIEEDALIADKAYNRFRESQIRHGGSVTAKDKAELRRRFNKLDAELDRYLAGEYRVKLDKVKEIDAWRASHQPFHWLVEFFGIMRDGGFDVIIGNPPYVEYAKVKSAYTIRGYTTESCGNLYAFTWERCIGLCGPVGKIGMIVPVASVCTDGYEPLQKLLRNSGSSIVSAFNDRPSKLFDGLEHIRLSIIVHARGPEKRTFSTTYNKWQAVERPHLFHKLAFIETTALNHGGAMAKIGSRTEQVILECFKQERHSLTDFEGIGKHSVFYTRKLSHFVQILDFVPAIRDAEGQPRPPSELKELCFSEPEHRDTFLAMLNSTLFYWLITVYSDCRNLNRREIALCRFDFSRANIGHVQRLTALAHRLMHDIRAKSKVLSMRYEKIGELRIQCTYPKLSKLLIDDIDRALAEHFTFSSDQLDFLLNFDFKYRMGADDIVVDDQGVFPSTARDRQFAVLMLELVALVSRITVASCLDGLSLASRPDLCEKALIDAKARKRYRQLVKKHGFAIHSSSDGGIPWRELRTSLSGLQAVVIDDTNDSLRKGSHWKGVRDSFGELPAEWLQLVIVALTNVTENASELTQAGVDTKALRQSIKEVASAAG